MSFNLIVARSRIDNQVVSIDDMNETHRGLACNCICDGCGSALQARMGEIRVRHFAHHGSGGLKGGSDCRETHLHNLAKDCFRDIDVLSFQEFKVNGLGVFRDCMGFQYDLKFFPEITGKVLIKSHSTEKRINCRTFDEFIVSDIFIRSLINGILVNINIEIKVHNSVGVKKTKKIKDLNLTTIEIDLNDLLSEKELTRSMIASSLRTTSRYRFIHMCDKFKSAFNVDCKRIETEEIKQKQNVQEKVLEVSNTILNEYFFIPRWNVPNDFNLQINQNGLSQCLTRKEQEKMKMVGLLK